MTISIIQPNGQTTITPDGNWFRIDASFISQRYQLQQQCERWWKHGIVTAIPQRNKRQRVGIERKRIMPDHPRFIDAVVRRLRMYFGSASVRLQVDEEGKVDQRLALELQHFERIPTLQVAVKQIRNALPTVSINTKKDLLKAVQGS